MTIEQLEQKVKTLPDYVDALMRVQRVKKSLLHKHPILSPEMVSTRGKWEFHSTRPLQPRGEIQKNGEE